MFIKDKLHFADLCNALGLVGSSVEVGVWRGDFSYRFLQRWHGRQMYLVDPWKSNLPDYEDDWKDRFVEYDLDYVKERLVGFGERVIICQATSQIASQRLFYKRGELDFVFLDANHSYEYTRKDIALWWPMIRPGGILAGHDWNHPNKKYGVTRAVTEFSRESGLPIHFAGKLETETDEMSWWFYKEPNQ